MILQFKAMHSVLFSFTDGSACLKSTSNVGKSPTIMLQSQEIENHIWKTAFNTKAKMTD